MLSVSKLGIIGASAGSETPTGNVANLSFQIGLYQSKITDLWGYDRRMGDDPITNPSDPRYGTYNNHYLTQTMTFGSVDNDMITIRGNQYRLLSLEWNATGGTIIIFHDPDGEILTSDIISVTMPGGTFETADFPGVAENVAYVPIDVNEDGLADHSAALGNEDERFYTQLRISTGPASSAWNDLVIGETNIVTIRTAL